MRLCLTWLQLAPSVFYTCRFGQRRTMSRPPSLQKFTLESHTLDTPNYETWTREELIARLKELTGPSVSSPSGPLAPIPTQVQSSSSSSPPLSAPAPQLPAPPTSKSEPKPKPTTKNARAKKKSAREFDFSAYPTRKIALKFSYAGAGYGGLAYQAEDGPTPLPLPTVEGVLFAALAKARLVDPQGGLEGCGWERCGRTDRGVSAAGQVVSLYVRSSHRRSVASSPTPKTSGGREGEATNPDLAVEGASGGGASGLQASLDTPAPPAGEEGKASSMTTTTTMTAARDIRYLHTLNVILPPSIRVYAWAPVAPSFSARFSCRARHYKYFFSARNLDVDAMRNGAARLVGEHDFRNLCKLDPAKQLTSFRRRILRADISPLDDDDQQQHSASRRRDVGMHVFDLVGTAFLYNQVRHIMAVLLLIGARLESPSVISALLNADPNRAENNNSSSSAHTALEDEAPPPLVTCKPEYQMADALPLVLWDCVYAEEDTPWRTDDAGSEGGSVGLHTQMTGLAERAQVEATLAEHFLAAASQFHAPAPVLLRPPAPGERGPWDVPLGGGTMRREGRYVELVKRKRLESVEVVNARYRCRKEGKSRVVECTG